MEGWYVSREGSAHPSVQLCGRKEGSAANARYWQEYLFWYGFTDIGIDGDFGQETERYTKQFQAGQGLPATGVCNKATINKAKTIKLA